MTLQKKFLLLISLLALAIAASSVGAFWAFRFVQQALGTPFQSSVSVLEGLRDIKRSVEQQGVILAGGGADSPDDPTSDLDPPTDSSSVPFPARVRLLPILPSRPEHIPGFRALRGQADLEAMPPMRADAPAQLTKLFLETDRHFSVIEASDWYRRQIGSTWRNIKERTRDMQQLALQATSVGPTPYDPDPATSQRMQALLACYQIHELIERSEERVLVDAGLSLSHAEGVQNRLIIWLASIILVGVLLSVLAVILLRRWVRRPVAALRDAAAHIARGDLTYRIPVTGRDELGLLSAEVNHMAQMVHVMQEERVERERLAAIGGMVRRLVHNVRNPLAGIRGLAEVTRLDFPKGTEHRDNLDLIVSTADAFERWLNELLSVTNPTTLNLQDANPRDWLRGVVEIHRPMAQSKGVELSIDDHQAPEQAMFDPMHLDHALAALVSNALEAAPKGSRVQVACRQATPLEWELTVSDQGPGVPKDLAARIFEPHFTTKRHGTGMGLAMAQQVVRAHGGRIRVESRPDTEKNPSGAVFRLNMPLRPACSPSNQVA